MKRKLIIFALTFIGLGSAVAQTVIKGTVKEKVDAFEKPLPFANVYIEGTTIGTTTDLDGNYEISIADAGQYTVVFSFLGFQKQTKEIDVTGNEVLKFDVVLKQDGQTLGEVKVAAKANRANESMLLLEQKKAEIAVESVGVKQLAVQGASDVSAAVTKVTGIVKQEGSQTFNVRGLGDRYNTTTLNGLPLPSNNAEYKNVDLKMFDTDVISHVQIEKSYRANLYGDFGGANIDIKSKKFIGRKFLQLGIKQGVNSSVVGLDNLVLLDGANNSGFYSGRWPNEEALRDNTKYDFDNSWNPTSKSISPNTGIALSGGNRFELGKQRALSVFFTTAYDNEMWQSNVIRRNMDASGAAYIDSEGARYTFDTQSTAMLNVNLSTPKNQFYYNSLFVNSSNQFLEDKVGFFREEASSNETSLVRRGEFERNMIFVNQFLGDHELNSKTSVHWGVAYNYLTNAVPDRRNSVFETYYADTNVGIFSSEPSGRNFRYFHDYVDNEVAGNLTFERGFGDIMADEVSTKGKLVLGYSGRFKVRDFRSNQYMHMLYSPSDPIGYEVSSNVDRADSVLNNENFTNGDFRIQELTHGGFKYIGNMYINAGFASVRYSFSEKLLLIAGVRFESVYQKMDYVSNQGSGITTFDKLSVLPSFSLKYALNDKSNLRLMGSKTYTLPQLSEMPDIIFEGITEEVRGNPYLYPSDVYNIDLKWELFPRIEEAFSVAGFGKYIQNPMNKFVTGSSSTQYSIANTGDMAYVYGLELDARKTLFKSGKSSFRVLTNLTLMDSYQQLDAEKITRETQGNLTANFNGDNDRLQGAANTIFNASLVHNYTWGRNSINTAVVYNYVSNRIYSLGYLNIGNRVDQPYNALDFVLRTRFNKLGVNASVKNILNQNVTRLQEGNIQSGFDNTIYQYQRGTKFQITIAYKF